MKKLFIAIALMAMLAIAPNTFACDGPDCYAPAAANANAAVIDVEFTRGGFIGGGAIAAAGAQSWYAADAFAGANSAMFADSFTYGINGGYGRVVMTDGIVSSAADANGGWFGNADAFAAGSIVQGSHVEVGIRGAGATAQNTSGAAYMSSDSDHTGWCNWYADADANGFAATGGISDAYVGKVGPTKFSGAFTSNYAYAEGDMTVAGGSGSVASYSAQPGALTTGTACFTYNGNGSGNAQTYSQTTVYRSGGVSYKSAFSQASASVNRDH